LENLAAFGNTPIEYATLVAMLSHYKSPKDKIAALEKQKKLIRIKKGLFVAVPKDGTGSICRELIANHLYGPSYISLESALSFHNLIPERVYSVLSVTTKRSKKYNTPFGIFDYRTVLPSYFSIGIQLQKSDNKTSFLMASPEKALCDMILLSSGLRLQSSKAVKSYLEEDLRLDLSEKQKWNSQIILDCLNVGKKKTELTQLLKFFKNYE
jgi:hypothetical protein